LTVWWCFCGASIDRVVPSSRDWFFLLLALLSTTTATPESTAANDPPFLTSFITLSAWQKQVHSIAVLIIIPLPLRLHLSWRPRSQALDRPCDGGAWGQSGESTRLLLRPPNILVDVIALILSPCFSLSCCCGSRETHGPQVVRLTTSICLPCTLTYPVALSLRAPGSLRSWYIVFLELTCYPFFVE